MTRQLDRRIEPLPAAGAWTVVLKGYLNAPTTYTGTAEFDTIVER